jgi:hypothetical protein
MNVETAIKKRRESMKPFLKNEDFTMVLGPVNFMKKKKETMIINNDEIKLSSLFENEASSIEID